MRNLNPITKILCILAINITITFGVNQNIVFDYLFISSHKPV